MKPGPATVAAYLAALPEDRRAAISAVRDLVNRNLPKGYRETIAHGMLAWAVPLEVYPDTYNGQPLMYAALASQKQYIALHLMTLYGHAETEREFRDAFAKAGKKLDMGKACVRFRSLEDLHLPAVARAIAVCPMAKYVELARAVHSPAAREARRAARVSAAKKPGARTGAAGSGSGARSASKPGARPRPGGRRPS